MVQQPTRRRLLVGGAATAATIAIAGCTGDDDVDDDDVDDDDVTDDDVSDDDDVADDDDVVDEEFGGYEVWALDQGQDNIHIYEEVGEDEFDEIDDIDINTFDDVPDEGVTPHMIAFSSDYEYAAVACTGGARVLVFETETRELVGNVETGPRSHMAAFSPDDEYIHVDVIGEPGEEYGWISRVEADLENNEFEEVDTIDFSDDDVLPDDVWPARPICHMFDGNGRSIHTLGPGYGDAGLVIVDHDEFEVDRAYSQEEIPTNCGTMPHFEDDKFYLTAGLPSDPDADEDGVGSYYVYDTAEDELIVEDESTEGVDAHGFWFTPDGDELWVLNRETNDGVVVDPDTDEVVDQIDAFGPATADDPEESDAPDIMWTSPDGKYMFVSLRGPVPLSGDPHAATGVTPGFSVLDIESREIVTTIEPDEIANYSDDEIQAARDDEDDAPRLPDFHGIGVRPTEDFDTAIGNSPPF